MVSGGPYKIGQIFGAYRLEAYLGAGAFKNVYRARNVGNGPGPAVVALGFPHIQDSESVAELEREHSVTSRLVHPNILRVYAVMRAEAVAFLVMDFVAGRNLRTVLRESGALDAARATRYVGLVCDALAYAHSAHVFHRDIKPENILVTPEGEPLLVDFGVARLLARTTEKAETRVGTLEYMAPELFHGAAGTNADLWALGVTLYELLTGARPFTGEVGEVMSKISSVARHDEAPLQARGVDTRLIRVLRKALSKDPETRYQRAEEFARDLEAAARRTRLVDDDESRLEVLLKASIPLVYVVSFEEERVLAALRDIAARLGEERGAARSVLVWSASRGLMDATGKTVPQTAGDPTGAIYHAIESPEDSIYVLLDIHRQGSPAVSRLLRDAARVVRTTRKSIVLLSPVYGLADEIAHEATLLQFHLPDRNLLEPMIDRVAEVMKNDGVSVDLDAESRATVARSAMGLTLAEAERALRLSALKQGVLDRSSARSIAEQKSQIIRKSGILEYYDTSDSFADVAGLKGLLSWFSERYPVFAGTARYAGLPAPRGVLLVGVPGCGKSLAARALAGSWRTPLVRLDVGKIFGSLVGEAEANLRRAIQTAEAVSPCILWIDEIEKGFAGSQSQSGGGVGARVFATFLTWLQDKRSPVFVVATANDLRGLPPELLRQGRFDETFFVGLPDERERTDAWRIHLQKRKRDPGRFDIGALTNMTAGYSGAEIEQCVVAGLYRAFGQSRDVLQGDMAAAIAETQPLSQAQPEQVSAIVAWGLQNARPASAP